MKSFSETIADVFKKDSVSVSKIEPFHTLEVPTMEGRVIGEKRFSVSILIHRDDCGETHHKDAGNGNCLWCGKKLKEKS